MSNYYKVMSIINKWDPIELLHILPQDEYSDEIQDVIELINKTRDIEEISAGIYKIFIDSFGDDVFRKSRNECLEIAQKLVLENEDAKK